MARRFATFVLLGPFLVWFTLFIGQMPDLMSRPSLDPFPFYGLVLAIVYIVGFLPSFALGCIDHLMAWKGLSRLWRAVACAVLAYPVTQLGARIGLGAGTLRDILGGYVLLAGLFGVIPAAICSWLSARGA